MISSIVLPGMVIGLLWGGISLGLSAVTQILFKGKVTGLETGFSHDLFTFIFAGIIYGFLFWSLFLVLERRMPFKKSTVKGVVFSLSLWGILLLDGFFLSLARPERYHPNPYEIFQGGILFLILGLVMGVFRAKYHRETIKEMP